MATPGLTDCHQQVVKLRMCEKKLLQAASLQAGEEERLARELEKSASKQEKTTNSEVSVSNEQRGFGDSRKERHGHSTRQRDIKWSRDTGSNWNDIPPDDS